MVQRRHKYGNASQVKCYADGGKVKKKKNPLPPPKKGASPKKIETDAPPGGSQTPGAKGTYRRKKRMADGGKVYGAPIDGTPKPGGTTRKRPKVGDKSNDTSRLNPKKRTPSRAAKKAPKPSGSTYRDYRGVDGVVEDAVKGKKK